MSPGFMSILTGNTFEVVGEEILFHMMFSGESIIQPNVGNADLGGIAGDVTDRRPVYEREQNETSV
jgi:hypothetical protein